MSAIKAACREGREAVKAGKPRVSPYEAYRGDPVLAVCHRNWLFGYDAMAEVIVKDPVIWGLPDDWKP